MLTQCLVWLNTWANAIASILLAPIAVLPGWLSITMVAFVTGILMLLAFKYTSNQDAIKRVRNTIKANLWALSLFKDSLAVSFRCQGRILVAACHLILLAIVPMLVMLVPMCLLLGQLSVWYQARPLQVGEETVVTLQIAEGSWDQFRQVQLAPTSAIGTITGPVRVPSKCMISWKLQPAESGHHRLMFRQDGQTFEKELAVGDGFMQLSARRPAWRCSDVLVFPRERPLAADSPVQSIELVYPARDSWTAGSKSWLIYWFAASMLAALVARPLLRVNV